MNKLELAKYIDHTALKATVTEDEVLTLCREAKQHQFAAVCVNPYWIPVVHEQLLNSGIDTCTVVGFPLGANPTKVKEFETEWTLDHGADEVDMVVNVGEIKKGQWTFIENEIASLASLVHNRNNILKVIFETCFLSNEEITKLCHICVSAGADFVKTSTGFGTGGATVDHVKLMADTVNGKCKVKASGGIRSLDSASSMINAGADRIGTSSGVAIISEIND